MVVRTPTKKVTALLPGSAIFIQTSSAAIMDKVTQNKKGNSIEYAAVVDGTLYYATPNGWIQKN
jgi:hypothetical protein